MHNSLRQVTQEETQYIRTVDNLIASRLSLKLQLQAVHFVAAANANGNVNGNAHGRSTNVHMTNALGHGGAGGLMLRCTAQIGDLYQEYKEIELGSPQKDPVPARGKPQPQQTQSKTPSTFVL